MIIRFDLVFFKILDLNILDNKYFYVVDWGGNVGIVQFEGIEDYVFLSNSELIDEYGKVASEIKSGVLNPIHGHKLVYTKLMNMFNNDISMVKSVYKRFKDVELYRTCINPGPDFNGSHALGELETKPQFEKLLNDIKNNI